LLAEADLFLKIEGQRSREYEKAGKDSARDRTKNIRAFCFLFANRSAAIMSGTPVEIGAVVAEIKRSWFFEEKIIRVLRKPEIGPTAAAI
jgi:hypothetical protein